MKRSMTTCVVVLCLAIAARADTLILKNGDRVTGTLVNVKGVTLQLKTDNLGVLSIPLAQIATYTVDKPVVVAISGQAPMQGTLQLLPSGEWQLNSNGQTQTIAAGKVQLIMLADEYQKVEVAPEPWQAWKGGASLGYSLQNGNQETNTLTTNVTAIRERPETPIFERHTRTSFDFTTLFSHAHQDGNTVTSRTVTANLREDYLLTTDNFVFAMAQVNHVSTQGLYLQQTYGGGFGRTLINNSRTKFAVLGGPTYVQEKFFNGSLTRTAELLIAENLGEQFNSRVRLDHFFQFYPDLVHGGQYRFDTSTVLALKLSSKFSVNTSLIDLYLSNPPVGNKSNNVTFSLGIGYTF